MRFSDLRNNVTEYLTEHVSEVYAYHNVDHTNDVVAAVEVLAALEGLSDRETMISCTAALIHDIGYVDGRLDHEERSCAWAREHLGAFEYDDEAIEAVCNVIQSTRIPQSPADHISRVVCDADVSNLGSTDYTNYSNRMLAEYRLTRNGLTDDAWLDEQIRFFTGHTYFTESARRLYDPQKTRNLAMLTAQRDVAASTSSNAASVKHPYQSNLRDFVYDSILAVLGVLLASIALKNFLVPNRFIDGGVTGLSILLHELNHWNLGVLIVLLNVPLIIAAYYSAGKRFAYGMAAGVALLGISLEVLPMFPVTDDKLLVSVFGGAFLGIGVGLVMRAGAALDGIEVLALYTLRRTSFTIAEIILGINVIMFAVAALAFGIETALYSVLTYFTATRCIDFVVEGLEAFTGVTIISQKSEEIKHRLVNNLGRGITVYKGERGYLPGSYHISNDCDIIFTVITRLELRKLKNLIAEVDPNAFVFASTIKDASGGIIARKKKH